MDVWIRAQGYVVPGMARLGMSRAVAGRLPHKEASACRRRRVSSQLRRAFHVHPDQAWSVLAHAQAQARR
jgi:hypothetical protein